MDIQKINQSVTPDIYRKFKTAIEIGKWQDGKPLSKEQKAICLQAVIAYEHLHVAEQDRVGYVPPKKTSCDKQESALVPKGDIADAIDNTRTNK